MEIMRHCNAFRYLIKKTSCPSYPKCLLQDHFFKRRSKVKHSTDYNSWNIFSYASYFSLCVISNETPLLVFVSLVFVLHQSSFCFRTSFRLKQEQRWISMPQWKINLLSRRGTEEIYAKYHDSATSLKCTRSEVLQWIESSPQSEW